ncbi:LPXTG cell wall anchor domain-containing protein [Neobacillus dielmonensis]|nr:LPXTG cell wall anchor domain-containing protein [Neobacillus dielmonensis]
MRKRQIGVAAAILIGAGIGFFFRKRKEGSTPE